LEGGRRRRATSASIILSQTSPRCHVFVGAGNRPVAPPRATTVASKARLAILTELAHRQVLRGTLKLELGVQP
jgi:hypothetical protein